MGPDFGYGDPFKTFLLRHFFSRITCPLKTTRPETRGEREREEMFIGMEDERRPWKFGKFALTLRKQQKMTTVAPIQKGG